MHRFIVIFHHHAEIECQMPCWGVVHMRGKIGCICSTNKQRRDDEKSIPNTSPTDIMI